ncbi:MAG: glycosyltransferase family 4 protein [Cyclobacteriaceae bacterium]
MIKVLYFCSTFYPENSGYSNAFQNFLRAISSTGEFDIQILTSKQLENNEELVIPRSSIKRLKPLFHKSKIGAWLNKFYFAIQLNQYLNSNYFNVILFETIEEGVILSLLRRKYLNKILFRIHATFETEYTIFFPKFIFKLNKYLLKHFVVPHVRYISATNSYHNNFYKKYFLNDNLFSIVNRNFFVLPNTILVPRIDLNKTENEFRSIFILGRMNEEGFLQKGFEDFINACILLGDEYLEKKVRITIVGQGVNSSKIRKKIEENNLSKIVKQIPTLSHEMVQSTLRETDIVVLPSRFEGMSMFGLEAIANGAFVIFSNTGGLIELVDKNGLLFEPQNVEDLANKIKISLELSNEEILLARNRSIELFWDNFSPQIVAQRFQRIVSIINS